MKPDTTTDGMTPKLWAELTRNLRPRYRTECVQCGRIRPDTGSEDTAVRSCAMHPRTLGPTHTTTVIDLLTGETVR